MTIPALLPAGLEDLLIAVPLILELALKLAPRVVMHSILACF